MAEARILAGALMPVDQNDVATAPLQMQDGAEADYSRARDENVGLQLCHPPLRKSNIDRAQAQPERSQRPQRPCANRSLFGRKSSLRGGPTRSNMDRE